MGLSFFKCGTKEVFLDISAEFMPNRTKEKEKIIISQNQLVALSINGYCGVDKTQGKKAGMPEWHPRKEKE